MPRITTRGSRIDARRATTVGLASFATLTLVPLLAHAKPSERAVLLLAALPAAALFGYLAGYVAGSTTHLEAAALQTGQVTDRQLSAAQLQAAQLQAAQPSAPVISIVSEPLPRPGTGSPVGSGYLAALARPPRRPARKSVRRSAARRAPPGARPRPWSLHRS
ncbi:hypothetical protein OG218_26285 [Kineococcus sp. NBC_00420]|uniref:hypothetical protein n=1 Tax=Kineococcus sp. NBC_00420 TaxID=2903564 RepID=UPI002E1AC33A